MLVMTFQKIMCLSYKLASDTFAEKYCIVYTSEMLFESDPKDQNTVIREGP